MARNERTSKRVAKIAGRILAMDVQRQTNVCVADRVVGGLTFLPWSDIRALAASALTQAPERKTKRKVRRRVRK